MLPANAEKFMHATWQSKPSQLSMPYNKPHDLPSTKIPIQLKSATIYC